MKTRPRIGKELAAAIEAIFFPLIWFWCRSFAPEIQREPHDYRPTIDPSISGNS
jgi:hypothetical protein